MSGDSLFDLTGNTGSVRYMAPEVALHKHYNHKAEAYSFGVMLFEMIEQKLPYQGKNPRIMMEEVFAGKCWREPLNKRYWPHGFDDLLSRCWHKDVDERPEFTEIVAKMTEIAAAIATDRVERIKSAGCFSCFIMNGNGP